MLRLNENVGTAGNDRFDTTAFSVNFGLQGNDEFVSRSGSDFNVAIGGPGDDTYRAGDNSALSIADMSNSGGDRLIADGIGLYSPTSYSATIDGKHFVAGDTASGQVVYVMDFRDADQHLETVQLRDVTISYAELLQTFDQVGTTNGDVSWDQLPTSGYSGSEVEEAISFYQARAQDLLEPAPANPNDRISLDGQTGTVDGGAGLDTGVLSGTHTAYSITETDGVITLQGNGTQVDLQNVERLDFADGRMGFDSIAERAYRLYEAAFDREPDTGGLGYWIDQLDAGTDFQTVARNFIGSDEFRDLYGSNPTDTVFIELIYQNVLDRAPDAGGESYWQQQLAGDTSRAEVLARFSDSDENRANVAGQVDDGVFYI